jgi:hypothetical protein
MSDCPRYLDAKPLGERGQVPHDYAVSILATVLNLEPDGHAPTVGANGEAFHIIRRLEWSRSKNADARHRYGLNYRWLNRYGLFF